MTVPNNNDELFNRVKKVIAENLSVKEEEVAWESSFTNDLGADSLDLVELMMALESEFKCEIPDEDAEKIQTVASVVDYIASLQGKESGQA